MTHIQDFPLILLFQFCTHKNYTNTALNIKYYLTSRARNPLNSLKYFNFAAYLHICISQFDFCLLSFFWHELKPFKTFN